MKLKRFLSGSSAAKARYLRAGVRRLTAILPSSVDRRFSRSLERVHPETSAMHERIAAWATEQATSNALHLDEEISAERELLLSPLKQAWAGRYAGADSPRVLLHVANPETSIAGFSVMKNMLDGFDFLGIPARLLVWDESLSDVLPVFQPSILLTSWHPSFLSVIDWDVLRSYRAGTRFALGLIAAEEELEGPEVVDEVLKAAKTYSVDFFFKEDPPEFLTSRYDRYRENGHPIISIGYGANPIHYSPVPTVDRDLNYVFMGSAHRDKWDRYARYFGSILESHPGFLLGPGWPIGPPMTLPHETHRFIYARCRVGLNLHHDRQLREPLELNERTYNLAAAGIPQLVDNPPMLRSRFSEEALFIAHSPEDFQLLFDQMLEDPDETARRALIGQREVLAKNTVFHRAAEAIDQLRELNLA